WRAFPRGSRPAGCRAWSTPAQQRHPAKPTTVRVDPGRRVLDDVRGQLAKIEPAQSAALLGFPVRGFADPSRRGEEMPDPAFGTGTRDVDAVNVFAIGRVDQHPDLFRSLAGSCAEHVLARVELAGRQVPHPVPRAAPPLG